MPIFKAFTSGRSRRQQATSTPSSRPPSVPSVSISTQQATSTPSSRPPSASSSTQPAILTTSSRRSSVSSASTSTQAISTPSSRRSSVASASTSTLQATSTPSSRRSSMASVSISTQQTTSTPSSRRSSVAIMRTSTPCNIHQRALIVFCLECGMALCDHCLTSELHRHHELSSLTDAVKKAMDELMKNLKKLMKDIGKQAHFVSEASIKNRHDLIENNFSKSKENVEDQFKELKDMLEENKIQAFKLLDAQKDHMKAELRDIKQYGENHQEIEDVHEKLQELRSQIDQDPNNVLKECLEQEKRIEIIEKSFVDWEKEPKFDNLRLRSLEKSVEVIFTKSKACLQNPLEFADVITFDTTTAHEKLRVSENKRQVTVFAKDLRRKGQPNQLQNTRLRVLAEQLFESGQHYWEVDVRGCRSWAVGVVEEEKEEGDEEEEEGRQAGTSQLGHQKLSLMLESDAGLLAVLQNDVSIPVREQDVSFIGLFLDYKKEHLTFYNTATDAVMHRFALCRSVKLQPVFNITPEGEESSFLVLCDLSVDRPESPASTADSSMGSPNQRGEEDSAESLESPASTADPSVGSPIERGEEDRPESTESPADSRVGSPNQRGEENSRESTESLADSRVGSPNHRGEEDRPESPASPADSGMGTPNHRGEVDSAESPASTADSSVGSPNEGGEEDRAESTESPADASAGSPNHRGEEDSAKSPESPTESSMDSSNATNAGPPLT